MSPELDLARHIEASPSVSWSIAAAATEAKYLTAAAMLIK
jgi:hypothetical protein